jgi:asparagine synthase (glutamine-hydrolysing)
MCGIFGFTGFDDDALLARMAASLAHRGPDDEGRFEAPGVHLGHRRLAIIDPAGGHQPMVSRDGSRVLVLNGEIYNFREIRSFLEARGRTFATGSDAEVLLQLYEEEGPQALDRLNGMFAFAVHDRLTGELFLARDRLGIKPLHYLELPGRLLFASEIPALLCYEGPWSRDLSAVAVRDYLALRYVPDRSLFASIRRLPAGHHLTWRAGESRIERYWDLPAPAGDERRSDAEWVEAFGDALERSVRRMRVGDVPSGAFLSGGVDSGTLVALMARTSSAPVKTFTVGFGPHDPDALRAAALARRFSCDHHPVDCLPAHGELLPRIVGHLDDPMGIPAWLLAREAGASVKFALAGDGADEILAGYLFHRVMWAGHLYARLVPAAVRDRLVRPLVAACPARLLDVLFDYPAALGRRGKANVVDYLGMVQADDAPRAWRHLVSLFHDRDLDALLTPEFSRRIADEEAIDPPRPAPSAAGPFLDRMLRLQFDHWLPDNMLFRQDRLSMAHGLEVRVPYLDHELVELACRLPRHLLLSGLGGKRILRRYARRLLPRRVAEGRKRPFYVPTESFLRHAPFRDLMDDVLGESSVRRRGFFRPEAVRRIARRSDSGEFVLSKQAFSLVVLELWMRIHVDRTLSP